MPKIRKIKAKKIAADIRARATDFELMAEYQLNLGDLERIFEILVEGGAIRRAEVRERGSFFDDPANRKETRRLPRVKVRIPIEIRDLSNSSHSGLTIDLSEGGLRTRGIRAVVGDEKEFVIQSRHTRQEVKLRAVCIWVRQAPGSVNLPEAGFQIVSIAEKDLAEIRRLMDMLSIGNGNPLRKQ